MTQAASQAADRDVRNLRDPGSFRDPSNLVFHADGRVLRGLRGDAVDDWHALAAAPFFQSLQQQGKLCRTWPVQRDSTLSADAQGWPVVLEHERVPFVSYPYEWCFSMLRDAAMLHLEVLLAALDDGMTTKDGSAYNVQWRGAAPTFIDIGSFESVRAGEPWAGYRQFCQTMLYPLMLQAHCGLSFQPWMRAQVDGIEAVQIRHLFNGARRLKAGVFKHIHLHEALQARYTRSTTESVRADLRSAGFSAELVVAAVRGLQRLVRRLEWTPPRSHWTEYQGSCTYSAGDRQTKAAFVAEALAHRRPDLTLDLGANDGTYSRLAARHAQYVVAVEFDEAVVECLYRELRAEGERRVLPLVMDLANPSPGIGWRGKERAAFTDRARADLVLALALVHHLAIGRNVPLAEVIDFLAGAGRSVVVEFIDPTDPMASHLLANKPQGMFPDYRRDEFERLLAERMTIVRRQELPSGTRAMYFAVSRA